MQEVNGMVDTSRTKQNYFEDDERSSLITLIKFGNCSKARKNNVTFAVKKKHFFTGNSSHHLPFLQWKRQKWSVCLICNERRRYILLNTLIALRALFTHFTKVTVLLKFIEKSRYQFKREHLSSYHIKLQLTLSVFVLFPNCFA